MGIVIDIIIIAFILLSTFLAYRRGLVSLAVNLVAFVITIVVVLIIYKPIGNIVIDNTKIDDKIQSAIEENVEKIIETEETDGITNSLIESAKQGILPETAKTLSINIVYGITMLILFAVVRIALIFITALANLVAKLPILKQFNELGGVIYGLLRGVLITYVILMIINMAVSFNPTGMMGTAIENSYIAKTMTAYNVFNLD